MLYLIILSHRNVKSDQCFPSISLLAREMNLSDRNIQRMINELCRLGVLIVNSGKQGIANNYYFPREDFFKGDASVAMAYKRKTQFRKKPKSKPSIMEDLGFTKEDLLKRQILSGTMTSTFNIYESKKENHMDKFFNTLRFNSKSVQADRVLRIVESCKPKEPFDFLRVLSVRDDSLLFITKSSTTSELAAAAVSVRCPDVEIVLDIDESSYDPCYTHSIYYNGILSVQMLCRPCAFSMRVPSCLKYDGDVYKTNFFIPENHFVVRDDTASVAEILLKMALEDAPNKDGAKMLSSDSDAYDAALQTAEASLFRIYDPLLFIPFDIRDNCTADTPISDAAQLATSNAEYDSEFPF